MDTKRKAGVLSIRFVMVLLAVAVIVAAQHPEILPRIGYEWATDPAIAFTRSEAIRLGLPESAYVELRAATHASKMIGIAIMDKWIDPVEGDYVGIDTTTPKGV